MTKFYTILLAMIYLISGAQTYAQKAPYAGFGKVSKATGRFKTKTTRGYFKRSNGYKFVNPYSRS